MNINVKYKLTDELIPYARNSRTHSDEQVAQIAASIKEWGWTTPILVDETGGIIAGHGRLLAARKLKMDQVPTIEAAGWTDAQKRAYVIADNKLALNAGWDNELLALELAELGELGFDLDLTGFALDEIDALKPTEVAPGLTDEDAVPDQPVEPVTRLGDVWALGGHRVMCGDSTSIDAVNALMAGEQADLLLTDPPYNVAYEGGTDEKLTIKNDSMGDEDFRQFLRDAFLAADSVMRTGAAFYVWYADVETYNFVGAVKDTGWKMSQILIWRKSSLVLGRKDYHFIHEPCIYGWKEGSAHYWGNDRSQTTVMEFKKPARNGEHPTMKPADLFQYQVENSTKKGGVVLDLFGGSGTTAIACEKTNRQARLMELDPKYVDVIIKRWQDFTGKQAIHAETGQPFAEVSNDNKEAYT